MEQPLVAFAAPWTSPYHMDPAYPYALVNQQGQHLFIANKTAWTFFNCKDPVGVVERARAQGINVLRVGLETNVYFDVLRTDCWPWDGTREHPEWARFNEAYWDQVGARVKLAGEHGIGLDVVLYGTVRPPVTAVDEQRPYWERALNRLGKYANVLIWEIENEYLGDPEFQDACGMFFHERDPYHRPVCTSAGTTDDAAWPDKPWVDLAINHSCTSSTERHPLDSWYLAVARNTRAHGKPAFCNESGREKRHRNDDAVYRRKEGWLWCSAGAYWTYHSWEGCEGIDDPAYRGPGQEFMQPMAEFFQRLPFWRMAPNATAVVVRDAHLVTASLAEPDRATAMTYVCTPQSGTRVTDAQAVLALPNGDYRLTLIRPADGTAVEVRNMTATGLGKPVVQALPAFTDDLVIMVERLRTGKQAPLPGTL